MWVRVERVMSCYADLIQAFIAAIICLITISFLVKSTFNSSKSGRIAIKMRFHCPLTKLDTLWKFLLVFVIAFSIDFKNGGPQIKCLFCLIIRLLKIKKYII